MEELLKKVASEYISITKPEQTENDQEAGEEKEDLKRKALRDKKGAKWLPLKTSKKE